MDFYLLWMTPRKAINYVEHLSDTDLEIRKRITFVGLLLFCHSARLKLANEER